MNERRERLWDSVHARVLHVGVLMDPVVGFFGEEPELRSTFPEGHLCVSVYLVIQLSIGSFESQNLQFREYA